MYGFTLWWCFTASYPLFQQGFLLVSWISLHLELYFCIKQKKLNFKYVSCTWWKRTPTFQTQLVKSQWLDQRCESKNCNTKIWIPLQLGKQWSTFKDRVFQNAPLLCCFNIYTSTCTLFPFQVWFIAMKPSLKTTVYTGWSHVPSNMKEYNGESNNGRFVNSSQNSLYIRMRKKWERNMIRIYML